jgi:hypothetical protein
LINGENDMTCHARIVCKLSLAAIVVLLFQFAPAQAQFLRFVATSGDDANNCATPNLACRSLQRAHDAASSGSKIVVLDSGEFGIITITKSIAIAATGVHAHLFVISGGTGTTKITIKAGPDDVIDLDGLAMGRAAPEGANSGIDFIGGGKLHVRNCVIRNFGTAGIFVRGAGRKQVFVSDCTIADNKHGIWARAGHNVFLDRVTVEGNLGSGVRSQGSAAVVRISNSTVVDNGRGLNAVGGGTIVSLGNNAIIANDTNGAPTSTASLK